MADQGLSRLSDDEKTALAALLKRIVDADRYPLLPRIGTLKGILAKLQGSVDIVRTKNSARSMVNAKILIC